MILWCFSWLAKRKLVTSQRAASKSNPHAAVVTCFSANAVSPVRVTPLRCPYHELRCSAMRRSCVLFCIAVCHRTHVLWYYSDSAVLYFHCKKSSKLPILLRRTAAVYLVYVWLVRSYQHVVHYYPNKHSHIRVHCHGEHSERVGTIENSFNRKETCIQAYYAMRHAYKYRYFMHTSKTIPGMHTSSDEACMQAQRWGMQTRKASNNRTDMTDYRACMWFEIEHNLSSYTGRTRPLTPSNSLYFVCSVLISSVNVEVFAGRLGWRSHLLICSSAHSNGFYTCTINYRSLM